MYLWIYIPHKSDLVAVYNSSAAALSPYLKEEIDHYTGNYAPSLSDKCVDSLNVDPLPTT